MKKGVHAITLELTEQCNLRCDYCFTHGKRDEKMSIETAKKTIDWLIEQSGEHPYIDVAFWGGEPLMGLRLLKPVVEYIKEKTFEAGKKYKLGMTTNGTLLTHETLQYLKQENIGFSVSLDGREEAHNAHRPFVSGKGSYQSVKAGIKRALEYFPRLNVRLSLTADNGHMLASDIKYFYNEWGVVNFNFSPVWEHDWTEDRLEMMEEQFRILAEFVVDEISKGKGLIIRPFEYGIRQLMGKKGMYPCGAGRHYLGVSTEGALYPCHRFHKFSDTRPWEEQDYCIGHIKDGFTKKDTHQLFYDYSIKENDKCKSCDILDFCTGHCYASCLDIVGDINKFNDAMCHWNRTTILAAKFLLLNLSGNKLFSEKYLRRKGKRNGSCDCNAGCYKDNGCDCYNACYQDHY